MKSSEERIDEELRKALKDRFDNFERLPDPTLRERILKGLSGGKGTIQRGLIASLLLLIAVTAGMFLVSTSIERENKVIADGRNVANEFSDALEAAPRLPENKDAAKPAGEIQTEVEVKSLKKSILLDDKNSLKRSNNALRHATRTKARPYTYTRADLVKLIRQFESDNSFGSLWIADNAVAPEDRAFLDAELKRINFNSPQPDSAVAEQFTKTLEGSPVADQDIGVLDHRPLTLPKYQWDADTLVTPGKPRKRYEFLFKEHWGIIAGFTPLRTFQILTVRPGNNVLYQNFFLPHKISAETVGYKFYAGVERNGFQLLLNYGQFKQSYRYEIATDDFIVNPDAQGNYQVVRKGIPQEENSTVRLLGVSVKKHIVRRSPFLRNYFGDLGAEFSRDLTSQRNMLWFNAGFGKELFAGNNVVMMVGPYLEYSLTKLRNPDNPFKIRPYQIGLSVGLRYIKK